MSRNTSSFLFIVVYIAKGVPRIRWIQHIRTILHSYVSFRGDETLVCPVCYPFLSRMIWRKVNHPKAFYRKEWRHGVKLNFLMNESMDKAHILLLFSLFIVATTFNPDVIFKFLCFDLSNICNILGRCLTWHWNEKLCILMY